jgi:hypothetical protein
MIFQDAYKRLKKELSGGFLHGCYDCGDSWGFVVTSQLCLPEEITCGGDFYVSKKTGEISDPITGHNRSKPTPIPVPRFAAEGWDYYDETTDSLKLKPDAPYWAATEFEEFCRTDQPERQIQPPRLAYA